MKVLVLGSAAGGGFPQWNCNCRLCAGQRSGALQCAVRTQSSIAISDDGGDWILLNASPDLPTQIRQQRALHPHRGLRSSPIRAVVLLDAQIDHVTGLLSLREGPRLQLHCTRQVLEELSTSLPIVPVLERYCGVDWHPIPLDGGSWAVDGFPRLRLHALPLPGKAPPYAAHPGAPGQNIALVIEDAASATRVFYAPGLAEIGDLERRWLDESDCALVDGTFWTEDEMIRAGLGLKSAAEMGHLPQSDAKGRSGMLQALASARSRRKVLIHVNNSNPILDEESDQRRELVRQGIEVAHDGMEIEL
jgi:pyrroloquinoline quinone biosynthesis protein B